MPIPPFSNAPSSGGGASTSNANTWTANQIFSGTANTAPSQTAASGSSLMTRDLVDARTVSTYLATATAIITNSATYTNFPISLSLNVGTWKVEWCVTAASTTSGNGYKYQTAFTGTAIQRAIETLYVDSTSTTAVSYSTVVQLPIESTNQSFPFVIRTNSTSGAFYNKGTSIVAVTAAGIWTIQAAQNTAAAGVTLYARAGSFMIATLLA